MIVTVSGYRSRTALSTSRPSPSSRRRSVRTRSYSTSRTIARAFAPLVAVATSYPSSWRIALIVTTTLSSSSTTRTLGCSRIARRSFDRQGDHEGGPAAHAAPHAHGSAMALHDALRNPEPEPSPLPGLRREEWLKDLGDELVRYAVPGVADLDLDGISTDDLRFGAGPRLRRNRDRPALRHRVGGVEQEIEEDLLELVRGRANPRQARIELLRDLHPAFAEALGDKTARLFHERVEIGHTHRFLLTVKAEHLAKDARHPLSLSRGDIKIWTLPRILTELLLEKVQGVLHGFERVVDLVRDRRGKSSGRRALLRVEEDLLEPAPLQLPEASDVLHDGNDRDDRPTRVPNFRRAHFHLETIVGPGIGQRYLSALRQRGIEPQTGKERREPRVVRERRVADPRGRRRGLEETLRGGIQGEDVIVVVHHDDRVGYVSQDQVEAVGLDADLLLGPLEPLPTARELFADVTDVGDVFQHRHSPAYADAIVGRGARDDLVNELLALDRIDQGDFAPGGRDRTF